jgi:eukaryotic-like serine/threonine-protein kinase
LGAARGDDAEAVNVTDAARDPPPIVSDRYETGRCIGRGGMATVYLAHDRKHDRAVAIKFLNAELSQTLGAERFLREIRIAARLNHPHILPLHDSGEADGLLYYVMPYVEGESLRDRLNRERQLPQEEALRIAGEALSALEHAHRAGVLHRDIKPENILLADGQALLADFGIARGLDSAGAERLTSTGLVVGTPAYMSPEQACAEPVLDARCDLYSLACVLYEMLAGEPPFTGATAHAIIAKRLGGPPPRIRTVRASVPEALEEVLLRALDPVPADRYPSAATFRQALEACTRGQPRTRRSRSLRAAAMTSPLGVAVVLTGVWMLAEPTPQNSPATTLAVLPLSNLSADPEHLYLAEGLTDALIGDLTGVRGIRVISRASVMRFASAGIGMGGMGMMMLDAGDGMETGDAMTGEMRMDGGMPRPPPMSVTEIARQLRADKLVQGSLSRAGDSVTVSVSLLRADPVQSVWSGRYVRHVRELFALQRDVAAGIVSALGDPGREHELLATPARVYDPGAHEAYLRGAYFQAHWRLPQAITAFERAIALDPTHAPAHAGLARAHYFLAFFSDIAPSIALGTMRRAANAALAQDSLLAEAHAQLALVRMIQDWDWAGAEEHFQRALEISPNNAQIRHDYAHFLLGQGRRRESLEETQRALALDPANPMLTSCVGWHSLFDGHHDEAIRFASDAHEMMPDHWAQIVLGWALLGEGHPDSALVAFREAVRLNLSGFTVAALAHGLAVTGHTAQAQGLLAELLERAEHEYVSPYDIATVYAGLGDADATFRWLRRASEERSMFVVHVGWDARFTRVRNDERFAALMERELRLPLPRFAAAFPAQVAAGQGGT